MHGSSLFSIRCLLAAVAWVAWLLGWEGLCLAQPAAETVRLPVQITWGHRSPALQPFHIRLIGREISAGSSRLIHAESDDVLEAVAAQTRAGGGDLDGIACELLFERRNIQNITNAQSIWVHLFQHGNPGAAKRLQADPAFRPDRRQLTVQMDDSGERGFSLTVDQLITQKTFWLPELDVFVAAGEPPESFADAMARLVAQGGKRVLDRIGAEPEASYTQFTSLWEDMGHPGFRNPHSIPPGHIVGIGWDSGIYKFGVDRLAGVRNDYAKADRFELEQDFGDPGVELGGAWKSQRLVDGLPILTTTFEKDGVRCEIEQFAFPLHGPPAERRGDIPMVLLQRTRFTELNGVSRSVPVRFLLDRGFPTEGRPVSVRSWDSGATLQDSDGRTLLGVEGSFSTSDVSAVPLPIPDAAKERKRRDRRDRWTVTLPLAARGTAELIVRLPSPVVSADDTRRMLALDYPKCRATTVTFWNDLLARGALFQVPEESVNMLFRANLWHALRLPRRHGGSGPDVKVDLPYSNFAYDQTGTPWPINQAVYVDYMLYDLRGHHDLSADELATMYRNNQEPNGHVGGFANWGVYTPSMLYTVAQHYLLSGDRASLDRLLPATLRALDWCLAEMKRAKDSANPAPGLVLAPLNDLSHDVRSWAFNQAYFVAGVDLIGRALAEIRHPRAVECRAAAREMQEAVAREFARATLRSPAVALADGTWSPYVPSDAQASGRLFRVWYPTDVDTGPLHLSRLKALDPKGALTTAMLHDHEDNLFIQQWGMINEPVYNQQATAYLLRDQPKPAIRAFYSMMACAFSHSVLEPVEHRWGWGQYFGPPSTDGAWFELYRNMLLQERDDDVLVIAQATPRAWLEDGKRIEVRRAPTYFGPVSFTIESQAARDILTATLDLPDRRQPETLLVRFRHPRSRPIQSVQVDGEKWTDFDVGKEWVRLRRPIRGRHVIDARYGTGANLP